MFSARELILEGKAKPGDYGRALAANDSIILLPLVPPSSSPPFTATYHFPHSPPRMLRNSHTH